MVWNVQQRPPASIAAECRATRLRRAAAQPPIGPTPAATFVRPGLKPGMFRACVPSSVDAGPKPTGFQATANPRTVPRRTLPDPLLASCARRVYTKPDVYASRFLDADSPPSTAPRRRPLARLRLGGQPRPAGALRRPIFRSPLAPKLARKCPAASEEFFRKNSYARETAPFSAPRRRVDTLI